MGNTAGVAGAEVKLGVGLIGILLAILTAVISVRSSRQPVLDETVDSSSHLVDSGEVVPAEFHARADMPTVLKPRASLPPPVYGVEPSPAEVRGSAVPRNGSAEALAMAGDAPAPRDFMPKLPARPPAGAPPTGNVPPRYPPDTTPAGDHPRQPRLDLEPTFDRPIATLPPAAEDVSTERHVAPAGQGPVEAAERAYPATTLPETAIGSENPLAAGSSQPDAAEQIPVGAPRPTDGTPGSTGQVNQPLPAGSPTGQPDGHRGGHSYTAEPGDSMWSISKKIYGTGAGYRALVEHNRARIPAPPRLAVGDQVMTPPEAQLQHQYPHLWPRPSEPPGTPEQAAAAAGRTAPNGGRRYLVEEGDSLSEIARYELGDVNRWTEVHQLNRGLLGEAPDSIRPGMWLVLPIGAQ